MGRKDKKQSFLSMSRSHSRSRSRSRSPSLYKRSSHHKHKASRKKDDHRRRSRSNSLKNGERRRKDRSRSKSRSRSDRRSRRERNRRSRERTNEEYEFRRNQENLPEKEEDKEPEIEPEKPCFIPSGILAKFTNTVNGVTLKFTEPPDAAVPTMMWRIYPFKGEEALDALHIHRQSCYLIGKDTSVADIVVENPTCSSQHAVIQFREIKKQIGDEVVSDIRPYLMDLDSKNGTFLNGEKLEPARYYQLLNKDIIKFASSSREYVIMNG